MPMTLNEYEEKAMEFAVYKDAVYPFLALPEEVGELLSFLARQKRGDSPDYVDDNLKDIHKELGDILWNLTACCRELGIELEEVARLNIAKLTSRQSRNVIKGTGDNR